MRRETDILHEYMACKEAVEAMKQNLRQDPEILRLEKELEKRRDIYREAMVICNNRLGELANEIEKSLPYGGYEDDHFRVSWRTTKSLIVSDVKNIVAILLKNDQVNEGVKSFNLIHLRKLADVGILREEHDFSWEYKRNLTVKELIPLTEATSDVAVMERDSDECEADL